ncbi:invasion associated locus B family protein [Mesorhizobium sp. SB112]|uniref:invasion associated locus B family protein n=1 Tax=Mesorhizobium sp. SB112 TaxID=3151853 RepID=UPI0032673200
MPISQQQAQQNGQRLLAIEMQPSPTNTITGNLVLPFGLLLDAGVALQIDEQPAMCPARFRTCLPAGCIVTLSLDQDNLAKLRTGTALKLRAKSSDTEQDVAFTISLKGFSAGLDRINTLVGN